MSGEQGLCSGVSVLCISAPLVMWVLQGSSCPAGGQQVPVHLRLSAFLLFPPEAADSVHGLAQTADTKEASPVL